MYSCPVYRAGHPRREPVEDPPAAVRDQGEGEDGHRQQGLLNYIYFLTLVNQRLGRGQLVLTQVKRLVLLDLAF